VQAPRPGRGGVIPIDRPARKPRGVIVVTAPAVEQVRGILDASDVAVTSRVTYPEGRAALSAAMRVGRLVAREHARFKRDLDRAFASLTIVELDPSVARAAGDVRSDSGSVPTTRSIWRRRSS
jgi:hypothetical protein